ncbi:MAG: Gfo/Idh/MocA family oxidoreductase [Patescibacteria group bacterium]|nr:Gfo/Idh/MocA family oxidoreductase [Patescibacteria group bacterium]
MKMIKIAFIGFGRRGMSIYGSLVERRGVKIVGIFDPVKTNNPINSGVKFFDSDAKEMIYSTEPNLVIITAPPSNHFEYLLLCERLNVPVICEKPIVTQKKDLEELKRFKIKIYPAYQLDYDQYINKAFELIDKSKILEIDASQRVRVQQTGWKDSKRVSGGGTLIDNASHFINIAISKFGLPKRAFSSLSFIENNIEQSCDVILYYDAFSFKIHSDWISAVGKENRVKILTEDKDIDFYETDSFSNLTSRNSESKVGWTKQTSVNYFISKGQERNLKLDPFGQKANQRALDSMISLILSDLENEDRGFARLKLNNAIQTGEIIDKLYSNQDKMVNI